MAAHLTEQQYLERNLLGYEGDSYIGIEIGKLVKQFDINLIFESGSYLGATTKRLAEFAKVISIEINEEYYSKALANTHHIQNIQLYKGDSVKVLKTLLPSIGYQNILFFLDAHWNTYCPLIDELKTIAKFDIKPVICIHDFQVPGHPEFEYDTYKGQPYNFAWIQPHIEAIYGKGWDGYGYHYNEKAEGAKRGVIFIYPNLS